MPCKNTAFALVDCNSFYAACERVFNPALLRRPVAVLSNNDGCIIARSDEVKQAGIPMGAPLFQYRDALAAIGAHVCSSNFELYGDISQRIMSLLGEWAPAVEVYSIDEAFLDFSSLSPAQQESLAQEIRQKILQYVGVPVSIGMGPTKTLAKVANGLAKKAKTGVESLACAQRRRALFATYPVEEVWGISRGWKQRLGPMGVYTVADFLAIPPAHLKKTHGVVLSRIQAELSGFPCFDTPPAADKKSILTSRSFTKAFSSPERLKEVLCCFAARGAEKLRQGNLAAQGVWLFWRGDRFKGDRRPTTECFVPFPVATNETQLILSQLRHKLKSNVGGALSVKKAGVLFVGLGPPASLQPPLPLFDGPKTAKAPLDPALDALNQKYGKKTLFFGAMGFAPSPLLSQRAHCSPRYTTRIDEVPRVH